MEENNVELELFRQQWRAEVSARSRLDDFKTNPKVNEAQPPKSYHRQSGLSVPPTEILAREQNVDEGPSGNIVPLQAFQFHTSRQSDNDDINGSDNKSGSREPRSALEHYEKAVEMESQGSLGDSLNLYRKAFRVGLPSTG